MLDLPGLLLGRRALTTGWWFLCLAMGRTSGTGCFLERDEGARGRESRREGSAVQARARSHPQLRPRPPINYDLLQQAEQLLLLLLVFQQCLVFHHQIFEKFVTCRCRLPAPPPSCCTPS